MCKVAHYRCTVYKQKKGNLVFSKTLLLNSERYKMEHNWTDGNKKRGRINQKDGENEEIQGIRFYIRNKVWDNILEI